MPVELNEGDSANADESLAITPFQTCLGISPSPIVWDSSFPGLGELILALRRDAPNRLPTLPLSPFRTVNFVSVSPNISGKVSVAQCIGETNASVTTRGGGAGPEPAIASVHHEDPAAARRRWTRASTRKTPRELHNARWVRGKNETRGARSTGAACESWSVFLVY